MIFSGSFRRATRQTLIMASPVDVKAVPHDNMAHVIIGVAVAVLSIASLSVGLRIYTRAYVVRLIGVDDYLSILALVSLQQFDM